LLDDASTERLGTAVGLEEALDSMVGLPKAGLRTIEQLVPIADLLETGLGIMPDLLEVPCRFL